MREHGPDALLPQRKEPMTREILSALLALPFDPSDTSAVMFGVIICVCFRAGFRKSEVCTPDDASFGRDRLCRSSLRWFIGGNYHAELTAALRPLLSRGDAALLTPPPAKKTLSVSTSALSRSSFPKSPTSPSARPCASPTLSSASLPRIGSSPHSSLSTERQLPSGILSRGLHDPKPLFSRPALL